MIMFGSPALPASFSGPPVLGAAFPAAVAVSAWLVVVAGPLIVFSSALVLRRHRGSAGRSAPTSTTVEAQRPVPRAKPLSVAVADVVVGVGSSARARAPAAPVAATMVDVFREADTLAHSDDGLFLILLEDTPEDGAVWLLERFRQRLAEDLPGHIVRVGLSCYPTYGFEAATIASQARAALASAREWHQDRIEVTTGSPEE